MTKRLKTLARISWKVPLNVTLTEVDLGAHQACTSPFNLSKLPTPEQKESGDYRKGEVRINGLDIDIECPTGSVRTGIDPDGNMWEIQMSNHYGYFRNTKGADGDEVDVFVKDGLMSSNPDNDIFVIHQVNKDGSFDEHKVIMGADHAEDAKSIYLSNYEDGWTGLGKMVKYSVPEFKSKFLSKWGIDKTMAKLKEVSAVRVSPDRFTWMKYKGTKVKILTHTKRNGEVVRTKLNPNDVFGYRSVKQRSTGKDLIQIVLKSDGMDLTYNLLVKTFNSFVLKVSRSTVMPKAFRRDIDVKAIDKNPRVKAGPKTEPIEKPKANRKAKGGELNKVQTIFADVIGNYTDTHDVSIKNDTYSITAKSGTLNNLYDHLMTELKDTFGSSPKTISSELEEQVRANTRIMRNVRNVEGTTFVERIQTTSNSAGQNKITFLEFSFGKNSKSISDPKSLRKSASPTKVPVSTNKDNFKGNVFLQELDGWNVQQSVADAVSGSKAFLTVKWNGTVRDAPQVYVVIEAPRKRRDDILEDIKDRSHRGLYSKIVPESISTLRVAMNKHTALVNDFWKAEDPLSIKFSTVGGTKRVAILLGYLDLNNGNDGSKTEPVEKSKSSKKIKGLEKSESIDPADFGLVLDSDSELIRIYDTTNPKWVVSYDASGVVYLMNMKPLSNAMSISISKGADDIYAVYKNEVLDTSDYEISLKGITSLLKGYYSGKLPSKNLVSYFLELFKVNNGGVSSKTGIDTSKSTNKKTSPMNDNQFLIENKKPLGDKILDGLNGIAVNKDVAVALEGNSAQIRVEKGVASPVYLIVYDPRILRNMRILELQNKFMTLGQEGLYNRVIATSLSTVTWELQQKFSIEDVRKVFYPSSENPTKLITSNAHAGHRYLKVLIGHIDTDALKGVESDQETTQENVSESNDTDNEFVYQGEPQQLKMKSGTVIKLSPGVTKVKFLPNAKGSGPKNIVVELTDSLGNTVQFITPKSVGDKMLRAKSDGKGRVGKTPDEVGVSIAGIIPRNYASKLRGIEDIDHLIEHVIPKVGTTLGFGYENNGIFMYGTEKELKQFKTLLTSDAFTGSYLKLSLKEIKGVTIQATKGVLDVKEVTPSVLPNKGSEYKIRLADFVFRV